MTPWILWRSRASLSTPKAGFTSSMAFSKSVISTLRFSSSIGAERSFTSTCLFSAKEDALLTRPSISAPLKFLVISASLARSTSLPKKLLVCILLV